MTKIYLDENDIVRVDKTPDARESLEARSGRLLIAMTESVEKLAEAYDRARVLCKLQLEPVSDTYAKMEEMRTRIRLRSLDRYS